MDLIALVDSFQGKEGHSAWPNRTINPVSALMKMLTNIDKKKVLDKGTKHFQPSIISDNFNRCWK